MNSSASPKVLVLSAVWLAVKVAALLALMHTGASMFVYERF